MENLISGIDYLLLLIFSVLAIFVLKNFVFRKVHPVFQKMLLTLFVCKVAAVLIYTLLVVYYWGLADSVSVFSESQNLIKLIKSDFSNVKLLFLPVDYYNTIIKFDSTLITVPGGAGLESNFFMTRICTLLYPFSFGRYLLVNFWFAFFSAIAQFKFYMTLIRIYPKVKPSHLFYIFLLPMLLFYTSPIYKETVCLALICLMIVNLFNYFQKNNRGVNLFMAMVNLLFIFLVKPYVFYALCIAVLLTYLFVFFGFLFSKGIFGKLATFFVCISIGFLVVQSSSFIEPYLLEMVDISNFNQQIYNLEPGESSSFQFGEITTSIKGLISKVPLSLYTCYFRPHLWEINKPILLASALESFLCLLILLYVLFARARSYISAYKENTFTRIIIFYIIILGILIGLTTFNFGTLVRYKAVSSFFLWLFVVLLLSKKEEAAKV